MSGVNFTPVQKLAPSHNVESFDCGHHALNQFLRRFALLNQKANGAQTYVCCERESSAVVGFYSLAVGSVESAAAEGRLAKGLAKHPVPVLILARLAVDMRYQGGGLGRALLKDALLRTAQAAELVGIRAILVHAKDDAARSGYLGKGFEPSSSDPYHLFLLVKDLLHILGR
ncbi:GNAT family N-acetyltransferase [Chlorobium sp. N1]|uniref:GNAT family N-acetyltransferase n=1 Tax=Chlorobium sp. N1 TaxID=2491138 RepID=UPI00103AC807|nr:GNAT family N-acetyltransferase [Chlorobium sp. N1]TCD47604.1 GNAT family N-acetyltransferase [Chlorobium sp. N1]